MRCNSKQRSAGARLVILWVALLSAGSVSACAGESSPPPELHGTWTTATESYADRAFTITDSSVTFLQGEGRSSVHRIVGVERETRVGGVEYTLEYEQGRSTLGFSFDYSDAGEIRLRNQEPMVWKRRP